MKNIISSGKLYVSQSKIDNAGRGVFVRSLIKKGEIIERCPVIEIPEHDGPSVNESILVTYIYYLGRKKERMMIALGFGSIYNHSDTPNAKYHGNLKEHVIEFIALKDIKKNQEVTVDYAQGNKKDRESLWIK